MNKQKLTTRIGKLLSGTRKPDEGFATIFVYEPKDYLEKQHGNLYFIVEVASGSEGAVEVGEVVINSIREEFYQDLNRSVILSFESALRKANDELSDITSAGETDWIGKLNVACAILSEEKLHLSKVGTIEVYILRGSKITHISEGLSVEEEKDKHPLKTFSSITSGSLEKDDKVVLSSSELFHHVSLGGVKKIVSENKPGGAIKKIKELLKNEEGIGSIGVLVIEMTTEEELAKESGYSEDEIWIEEPKPTKKATFFLASFFGGVAVFFKNIFNTAKNKVTPGISKLGKPGLQKSKTEQYQDKKPEGDEKTDLDDLESKDKIKDKEEDFEKDEHKPKESHEEKPKKTKKQENFIDFVVNYFKKFSFDKFLKDIKKVFSKLKSGFKDKTRSVYFKLFIVVALLFVISLFLIVRNYNKEKNVKLVKQKLDQAISLESKAEGALIYEARTEAKEYLIESKALTEEILGTKYYNKEAQELMVKIESLFREADGVIDVSPDLVFDIDEDKEVSSLTFLDKNIYFVNSKNNKLIIYNIEGKSQEELEISDSQVTYSQIASFPKKNFILMYNNSGEVVEYSIKNDNASDASVNGEFKKGSSLATYSSNFYILSGEDNQIYRYSRSSTGYSKSSSYITDKSVDIKSGVSLTIPGIVYVLKEDGEVIKLIKGKSQAFDLKEMPFDLKKPIKIQVNEESDKLYILDKELGIFEFSINGKYIKNITSSEFDDLKDFYVDEDSSTIYVLSGNKIFNINI